MKLKGIKLFIATACIVMVGMAACHSQKEMTNADGTKTRVRVNNGAPKKDAMMQGDTMKRDNR